MFRSRLIALMLILVASGCATTKVPYNPFKIPEEEFHAKIKMIALAPVSIPNGLENPEQVKAKFESLVEAKLREQGFTVIPSREYEEIWKKMTNQVGGFFDPVTGKRDESKFKAVMTHTLREMNAKFKADAVLYASVYVVSAPFANNTARWDGVSESLTTGGAFLALFGGQYRGKVPALSFGAFIEDLNEIDLYVNSGGIQVLSKISGGQLVAIPKSEVLANEARSVKAVDIALDALVKKTEHAQEPGAKP